MGRYRTPDLEPKYWADMIAHGCTSATIWGQGRDYDEQGDLLKGTRAEHPMESMAQAGLLHPDIPVMFLTGSAPSDPQKARRYASQLRARSKARGWPKVLFYGPDEPGNNPDHNYVPDFEEIQPLRPEVRIATALFGWVTPQYGKYWDVWVVGHDGLGPPVQDLAKKLGAEIWTYNCQNRGVNIPFHPFYAGLFTWLTGAKGNFLWAYPDGPDSSWEQNHNGGYSYILASEAGPVASVGWEARREGTEDADQKR